MKGVMKVVAIPVILALGAAGVGTYLAFRGDMRASRARLLAGSRVVSTACGPVEVAEVGDGPPVLVAHGTGAGSTRGSSSWRGGCEGQPYHRRGRSTRCLLRGPASSARITNGSSVRKSSLVPGNPPGPTTMRTPPHEMANTRSK